MESFLNGVNLRIDIHKRRFASILLVVLLAPVAVLAQEAPPGAELIYQNYDEQLYAMMETSSRPIISPDGQHLYLSRNGSATESAVALFTIDSETGIPSLSITYQSDLPDAEELSGYALSIRHFNAAGTRAYATFGEPDNPLASNGVQVLDRNTTTGELTSLQTLVVTAQTTVTGTELSSDGRHLYVSIAPMNSLLPEAELRTYSVNAANGMLEEFDVIRMPPADSLSYLQSNSAGNRLLASTSTELVEYARDTATGTLSLLDRFALPPLTGGSADHSDEDPGPVAFALTSSGDYLYTVRAGLVTAQGGYVNTLRRNPTTGSKTRVAQLVPDDFPDHVLFRSFQLLISDNEELVFVPAFHGRYFAGSPSPFMCMNALARNPETGSLSPSGTRCEERATGARWAIHPQTRDYYTRITSLRQSVAPFAELPPPGGFAIWRAGRAVHPTSIHTAVLPLSRTISERQSDSSTTFFAAALNAGDDEAIDCVITPPELLNGDVRVQLNDPESNSPLNPDQFDRRFNVPAGGVTLLTLTIRSYSELSPTSLILDYRCTNAPLAPQVPGVNHPILSVSNGPLPDMVTGAVTLENTGIARLPSLNGTGFFAASTINIGAPGVLRAVPTFELDELTGAAESNAELGNAVLRICETLPTTGECLNSPAEQVEREFASQEIATYTVFILGGGGEIPLDPARNRAYLTFIDSTGEIRGASSVAVTTSD